MKREPDRLGDALRKLAGGMTKDGTRSCRFTVETGAQSAQFEVRLVTVIEKKRPRRVGGVLVVYPGTNRGR